MATHREKATEYFKSGYNCAQAVVAAFGDVTGLDESLSLRLASSFGGGVGRMREVCGAFSGIAIVVGVLDGYDTVQAGCAAAHYKTVQMLAERYKQQAGGSIICRELLGDTGAVTSVPQPRNEQYYKKRPCAQLVGIAADILDEYIKTR